MSATLIITGGSQGIGKATAALFLENNWKVLNLSRSKNSEPKIINISVDLTKKGWEKQCHPLLQKQLAEKEKICLIHNACTLFSDTQLTCDLAKLQSTLEISVIAPTLLNQMIIPHMTKGSSILYVGSTLSEKGVPNTYSYITVKHAVAGMMRSTCQDLHGSGIHTACICPGFTETEMLQKRFEENPEHLKAITENLSEKRLIQPKEIAQLLYFSAINSVINGSLLHANLGLKQS